MRLKISAARAARVAAVVAAAAVGVLSGGSRAAFAASATWNGTVDGQWTNDSNWTAAHPNGSADIATFNGTGNGNTNITVGATPQVITSVFFTTAAAAAYTIGGGTLQATANGNYNVVNRDTAVTTTQTVNSPLELSSVTAGANNPSFRNNNTTGRLIINGGVTSTSAGVRGMTVNGALGAITELNGNFSASAGSIQMQVQNTGAIFSGTNTFGGGLSTASQAVMILNGATTSASQVVINNNSTFGGTGSLTANLQLAPSGTGTVVAPGDSTLAAASQTGTLSITGNVSYNTNNAPGVFQFQVGGKNPGDGQGFYDQLNVTGSVSFAGFNGTSQTSVAISTVNGYTPAASDVYYFLTRGDAAAFGTTFTNLGEGAVVTALGPDWRITYLANWTGSQATSTLTGGNDVAVYNVTGVPEPASLGTAAAGAAGLLLARRRRTGANG